MKRKLFLRLGLCCMIALCALALIGCGPPAGVQKATINVGSGTGVVEREYYVYTPTNMAALLEQDARQIPIVFSFHDQGQDGAINANITRWHEVAEANGFVVVFPSAVDGTWNTLATAATTTPMPGADELAFVKTVWTRLQSAPTTTGGLNLSSGNPVYLTGIGAGAGMAHQLAMVGANLSSIQVISSVAGILGTADASIFSLPTATAIPAGASLPRTSMAVWMFTHDAHKDHKGHHDAFSLSKAETRQAEYWKGPLINNTTKVTKTSDRYFETISYKNAVNPLQEVRISNFKTLPVLPLFGKALSEKIWNEMFSKACRFLDDTRVNGSLHPWESISQMGLTEESKEFSATAGGKQRWLTYLPSNYAALTAGGAKIPVVFSLHGRKGSARWQAMMTQWHKVAETKGFIMIYPQGPKATWDCSLSKDPTAVNPDVQYFLELLAELKTRYAVDPTRVYLNGTSMGSFFANVIGVQYPQIFASIAPCYSGHLSKDQYTNYALYPTMRVDLPMPIWQCHGADEPMTAFPGSQEDARRFWRVTVNKYAASPTGMEDDAVPSRTEDRIDPAGRKVVKVFEGGLADYRWQVTDYVPHFWNLPDQAEQMWNDMFSHYTRNADGTLTRN